MSLKPKDVFFLLGITALFILLFQNSQVVSVNFLFWKVSMSKIILIIFSMLIAFIVGFIVGKRSW